MSLRDYLIHYLNPQPALLMLFTAAGAVIFCVSLIHLFLKKRPPEKIRAATEQFYELIFSATTILLFTGTYFLIDFLGVGSGNPLWVNYSDFILLGFILGSVVLTSVLDNFLIPLRRIQPGARSTMRLLGMLYMLVVFAYVKFIYQNDNYDRIILYFLTLVIGRFVYFDASVEGFAQAAADAIRAVPLLILALLCSGLIAYTGFTTGYLLHQNGVVFNLFIGHLYLLAVIFVLHWVALFLGFLGKLRGKAVSLKKVDAVEEDVDYLYEETDDSVEMNRNYMHVGTAGSVKMNGNCMHVEDKVRKPRNDTTLRRPD